MKITMLIFFVAIMQVSANTLAQTVTLKQQRISLNQVFDEIRKQTGYDVYYVDEIINTEKTINANFNNSSLDDVLKQCLKDQNLSYAIDEKTVIIKKGEPSFMDKIKAAIAAIDVTGRVTDENNQPLVGATIQVKGEGNGATTDANGFFTLKQVQQNATIVVSFIGYDKIELLAKANLGQIKLHVATNPLDEVKVIAYGTTTQRLTTSNITTVKSEDIEKQPVTNPLLALQGLVPGLLITPSSGIPGSVVTVQIEGRNSISNGTTPLYVIDGVPYPSQLLPSTNRGSGILNNQQDFVGGSGNVMSYINPSDIESISILKDADATAIYGSRAANGAILITTKKGKQGAAKTIVDLQSGWGKVARFLDLMNTQQYLAMRKEAFRNDGRIPSTTSDYDLTLWDTTRYTNWQKVLIGNTAKYANVNLSVSGGTESVQYLVSGTFNKQTSVFPGDFSDMKGTLHSSLNTISTNKKFHTSITTNFTFDQNTLPDNSIITAATQLAPDAPPLYNLDGTLNWAPNGTGSSTWTNPLAQLLYPYVSKTRNFLTNLNLAYELLPGLTLQSNFGYNRLQTEETAPFGIERYAPEFRLSVQRTANYSNSAIDSWNIEPQINLKKQLWAGTLNAVLGGTFLNISSNGLALDGRGYATDALLNDPRSAATLTPSVSTISTYRYNAAYGRINYILKDKYIINLSGRRDGSSRFGSENSFHNFWGTGLGWIFSEESFLKKNLSALDLGKVRVSYGTTGSDQIGDYKYMSLASAISSPISYEGITTLAPTGHANPYLQWEETRKFDAGIDLDLLKGRINMTVDYVMNRSSNQLINYALPNITGFLSVPRNFPATIQNTEWQFSFTTINLQKIGLKWSSSFNITLPQNKVVSFPDLATSTYASSIIIGQPIGITKAYKYLGVDPTSGLYVIADQYGNPTATPTLADQTLLINTVFPKLYGGLKNSIQYKDLQLDVIFQFSNKLGSNFFAGFARPGFRFLNQPVSVLNGRWQNVGDQASIQKFATVTSGPTSQLNPNNSFNNMTASDINYTDASFARLKNLSLSYRISEKWAKTIGIQNARIMLNAENLFTITSYNGWDPETGSSLPPLRMVTIGLNATF